MKKNILICLEKLGIGGVETAVLNQAIALKEKGNKIVVLAKNGIYTDVLKQNEIDVIDFEFPLTNQFDKEKEQTILKIIDKYEIDQVHIHQLACIQSVWKPCLEKNIPYIAYVHSIAMQDYDWFINTYGIYNIILEPYFKYAKKIIVLAKEAIQNHQKRFPIIELSKYYVLPNCINFDLYYSNNIVNKIEKFVLISRLENEKLRSIKNGINLFLEFAEEQNNKNIQLDIIGSGLEEENIKKYIELNNKNNFEINIVGATNNIKDAIEKYDVVIGIGRCILEAIAMKKIAILSGIENMKGIITPKNIDKIILKNFVGRELPDTEIKKVINQLNKLNQKEMQKIISENYNKVIKELNIHERVYYAKDDTTDYNIKDILEYWIKGTNYLFEKLQLKEKENNEIWEAKTWIENQYNIQKELIEKMDEKTNG